MRHVLQDKIQWSLALGPLVAVMILVGCEKTEPLMNAEPNRVVDGSDVDLEGDATDVALDHHESEGVVFTSGLDIGEVPLPFEVDDVTGPNKGKSLCYRCLYGGRPVVGVFVRDVDENTKSLIQKLDQEVAALEEKKLAAFVVVLTDDYQTTESDLETIAVECKIKNVPLTIFEGTAGPAGYNIAEEAAVNVMVWEGEVKANRAFPQGQLNESGIQEVIADTRLIVNSL